MSNDTRRQREAHPLNAPGDFYVERDMCIVCCAPEHAAPDLIGFFGDAEGTGGQDHCYFKRQPQTPEELKQALEAIYVSCCGAVRYRGSDRAVLMELVRRGDGAACDESLES